MNDLTEQYIKGEPSVWHKREDKPKEQSLILAVGGSLYQLIMVRRGKAYNIPKAFEDCIEKWCYLDELLAAYEEYQALKEENKFLEDTILCQKRANDDLVKMLEDRNQELKVNKEMYDSIKKLQKEEIDKYKEALEKIEKQCKLYTQGAIKANSPIRQLAERLSIVACQALNKDKE